MNALRRQKERVYNTPPPSLNLNLSKPIDRNKRRKNMMTLHLKKCVSFFVRLSLLLSACSNSDKSSKASNKASDFTTRTTTQFNEKVKVEDEEKEKVKVRVLNYTHCSLAESRGRWLRSEEIFVEEGGTIKSMGGRECITKNGETICINPKDKSECKLTEVRLCDLLMEHCEDFEAGVTPVPCYKYDKPLPPPIMKEDKCLSMMLVEKSDLEEDEEKEELEEEEEL